MELKVFHSRSKNSFYISPVDDPQLSKLGEKLLSAKNPITSDIITKVERFIMFVIMNYFTSFVYCSQFHIHDIYVSILPSFTAELGLKTGGLPRFFKLYV
jgi:hypothetical protein